jgi:hypothetical protein
MVQNAARQTHATHDWPSRTGADMAELLSLIGRAIEAGKLRFGHSGRGDAREPNY